MARLLEPDVIDVSGLASGSLRDLERVAARVDGPARELGVFHVTGHGLDASALESFDSAMRALFALPEAAKRRVQRSRDNAYGYYDAELTKNRRDWKEIFDYGHEGPAAAGSGDSNRWPTGEPEIRRALVDHHVACHRLARALLGPLSVALGFAPDRLLPCFEGDTSFTRLNRYPVCDAPAPPDAAFLPEQGHLGVHPHSDAGALTILYQGDVPALQFEHDDAFLLVEPVAGALTINLGDMLRVWGNDRTRSPVHRVLARSDRERYSAPFFLNPRPDTVCVPILEGDRRQESPRFHAVSWARFRGERAAGDFADYGQEIQVDDYLVDRGSSAA